MKSVAGDALENQRRSLLNDATAELQRHQRQSSEHLQEYQQGVRRHLSEVQHQDQVQQVASGEQVEILRRELSQSFAEASNYQSQCTTSRSGASESSSEIQPLRQERDHLNVHGRNLETETLACQSAVRFLDTQAAQIPQLRGNPTRITSACKVVDVIFSTSNIPLNFGIYATCAWIRKSTTHSAIGQVKRRALQWILIFLSPRRVREMKDTSLKNWSGCNWNNISQILLPQVCGSVGTDDTTCIERVEPSSFGVLEIPGLPHKVLMFPKRSQHKWRETQLPRTRKLKNFSSKPDLNSDTSGSGERISGVKAIAGINEIDSAKSIADLKTSYSITRAMLQTNYEVLYSKIASGLKKIINGDFKRKVFIVHDVC